MDLAAIIVCGGESRRMGQPKAWLRFGPELMLQRVVRLVSSVVGPIVVVAAPGQELPELPEKVLVARDPERGRGPLQGLAAGLAALSDESDLVYATATDVPFLQPAWIERLTTLIGDYDLAIPRCEGFLHPLAALYRRASVLPACDALLQDGRLRPAFLVDILRARVVRADELRGVDPELLTLRNLNTPEDYRSALSMVGQESPGAFQSGNESHRPRVHVELFGVARLRAGVKQIAVDAESIDEVLRALSRICPTLLGSVLSNEGSLLPAYTLNINGQQFTTDPSTRLHDGDTLIVLPVDVGG